VTKRKKQYLKQKIATVGDNSTKFTRRLKALTQKKEQHDRPNIYDMLYDVREAQAAKSKAIHLETDCDTCTYKRVSLGGMED